MKLGDLLNVEIVCPNTFPDPETHLYTDCGGHLDKYRSLKSQRVFWWCERCRTAYEVVTSGDYVHPDHKLGSTDIAVFGLTLALRPLNRDAGDGIPDASETSSDEDEPQMSRFTRIMKQNEPKPRGEHMYVVEMKHNSSAEARVAVVEDFAQAAAKGREFAEQYDFEIREKDGEPALWDAGNDDGADGGYDVFDSVKWETDPDGEVGPVQFQHFHGDGPCLRTIESE